MTEKDFVRFLDYYDREVISLIIEKYGFGEMEALRDFIQSETYQMLADTELKMWDFSPKIIFDLWECEKITGDPRNSIYIKGA
ncbi:MULTISPECIES: hypothetical protein [Pasteurellaceae]|uniref:Uncharacterized protein n=1 Tax=Pasteurella atlantica TaxID=2827233 RepID=A0AAW8CHD8_9PAST|nr:hypothetical protein [Pasteurella atlantica]MBR0573629.1 hypothetical protein [Pasteurella atlantica]MDP8039384.1 hypothetical protein [Pasteurella atlantica]MDP8041476.1 hypothetical protein [Pasteurella atlantica]MDP8043599.1 hypothetical protein [Pasteurella atlantica]MDP8045697.1 hypothetical protein [Pasteurella atlantica]